MSKSSSVFFSTVDAVVSECVDSEWRSTKRGNQQNCECQTSDSLWEFDEAETQTVSFEFLERKLRSEPVKEVTKEVGVQVDKEGLKNIDRGGVKIVGEFDLGQTDDNYAGSMATFLRRTYTSFLSRELDENVTSKAFEGYDVAVADTNEEVVYWKTLSVDLERKKVVFPDWNNAKHFAGVISKCSVTRNKERLYDIDYDDGQRLAGVREEHIRWWPSGEADGRGGKDKGKAATSSAGATSKKSALASRLQEGVRVHAKVQKKGGREMYVPGRVVKVQRGGTYDVEVEGGKTEFGVSVDDLMIGLDEGGLVEARRPNKVYLQCTGVSWNATGSSVAVAYGRMDIVGWCDHPGAVCLWNLVGKGFDPLNPDSVLDHSSCIMCVTCHPQKPAVVVGGSFSGEIVVWDLTLPEQLWAVSEISEYGHKEPVLNLDWYYDSGKSEWLLCSVGADGRVLLWSVEKRVPKKKSLQDGVLRESDTWYVENPVKGVRLAGGKGEGKVSSRGRQAAHGGVCLAFAHGSSSGSGVTPKWFLVGQQGGSIARGQTTKALGGTRLGPESFKNSPVADELYPPLRTGDDGFAHEAHIGTVNGCACSPFNRNLFLSAGSDGTVKLFHMFDQTPLRTWEPAPPPGTPGVSGTFAAITCVQFSPVRPYLFAVGSADGFVFLFDLSSSSSAPLLVLEAKPSMADNESSASMAGGGAVGHSGAAAARAEATFRYRSGVTALAFNRKRRDLLSACDSLGRVHVWRLSWGLSHKGATEQRGLDEMVSAAGAGEAAT